MASVIELEGVTKTFGGQHALGPVDVAIPAGTTGLLGPNGAGKTTLIRLLLGLVPPDAGTIRVLGEPVEAGAIGAKRRIGYVPEGETIFPDLSGVESVAYAGELVGMPRVDALKRAHEVLDYVRLGEERYRRADGYSTGMLQRLKLAQALVHDPKLLILDEPTEGVDPDARHHLLDLIDDLSRAHGIHVLLSTHLLADVERIATSAVVLNQGRVVAQGTLEELKRATSKAYFVRVSGGEVAALTDRLTAAGVAWESAPPMVRVELEDPRAVLAHVRDAGLIVRHLTPATLSLEEAFEQAVGVTRVGA